MYTSLVVILATVSTIGPLEFPPALQVVTNPFRRRLSEVEAAGLFASEQPVGVIAGTEPLTRHVMEQSEPLAVISRCGVGLDSVDLAAAAERGILVFNTPSAPVVSVAEHAVTLILTVLKRIIDADAEVRRGGTDRPQGVLLCEKTVGIIGCGRIGTRVGSLCEAFGCRVIGYDPVLGAHPTIELTDLSSLLKASDIVSVHVPLTLQTRGLVGVAALERMKSSAFLVNTSRGGVIDEAALVEALEAGAIAGAGLDVFEHEPYNGPLIHLGGRVVLTPHIASNAVETRARMEREAVANLVRGLEMKGLL